MLLCGIACACLLNELGVFEVSRVLMWNCLLLAALSACTVELLVRSEQYVAAPFTKYVALAAALLLTLFMVVFLSDRAVLLLIFPSLMATQYRSLPLMRLAVLGVCIISVIAPVLSLLADAWGLVYMSGYLETVCGVSIQSLGPASMTRWQAICNVLMYISLPHLLFTLVFGGIFMAITRHNIHGLESQLRAMRLEDKLNGELEHVVAMQDRILYSIADMVENRDLATGDHVKRTSELVRILVEEMRLDPALHLSDRFCANVIKAAPLHDIGKIAVDDAILRKPGPLTEEERRIMQLHPAKSAELIHKVLDGLEDKEFIAIAANLAMYHHEWYDGSGYPTHRQGEDIPLEARIMSIADVFDALASRRSYKSAVPLAETFRIMYDSMGSQFDPALEKYFRAVRPRIEAFYQK